VSEQVSSNV